LTSNFHAGFQKCSEFSVAVQCFERRSVIPNSTRWNLRPAGRRFVRELAASIRHG
jgi:hypothetical protein